MMYRSPVSDHRASWLCLCGERRMNRLHVDVMERRSGNVLGALVDEAELAEQTDEASVLELAHKFALQAVDGTARTPMSIRHIAARIDGRTTTHFWASSSSVRRRLPIMSNSCPMLCGFHQTPRAHRSAGCAGDLPCVVLVWRSRTGRRS